MVLWELVNVIRQNHALEHATIHVLGRRNPSLGVMGRSTNAGFVIYGPVSTEEVTAAATEALARLQRGEAHLATHPRCGTNLAVTSIVAGTAAFGASQGRSHSKLDRLPMALLAATLGALFAQPLALRVQRHVTTTPLVHGVHLVRVTSHSRGRVVAHKVEVGRE